MSFKQYRNLDLLIFVGMYALCEYIVIKAATVWFNEPYSISIMLPLLLIVMMRWDKYCAVHAVAYALLFVYFQQGNGSQYLIYLIGNCFFLLTLLFVKKVGKEKIRNSFPLSAAYLLIGFLLLETGRGIGSVIVAGSDPRMILQFILTDMLSLVFGLLVIIIVRRVDGLFIDQKHYLLQLNAKKEKVDGGWEDE